MSVSDHTATQSVYLRDPDGNELELYVDGDERMWKGEHTSHTLFM